MSQEREKKNIQDADKRTSEPWKHCDEGKTS